MRYCLLFFLIFSCSQPESGNDNSHLGVPQNTEQSTPYLKYAKGFEIIQHSGHKEINIIDLNNDLNVVQKLFIGNGASGSDDLLPTPVSTAACNSTTHASFFSKLGIAQNLIGVSWPELIMNENIKQRIASGAIQAIGANGEMNLEVILKMAPDILMVYPYESLNYQQYEDAGLQLVYNTEYQEVHPLAKAEWIKLYGLLFEKEKEAHEIFENIEKAYLETAAEAQVLAGKHGSPSVFTGSFLNGQWFAPAAESSTVRSLKDAGASYVFEEEGRKGNLQLDFEVMYKKCQNADFYGKLVSEAIDMDDMTEQEQRLSGIKAVKEGNVFYCNTSESDYFGDALLEPHLILLDMVNIFFQEHRTNKPLEYSYFRRMVGKGH